jgi:hypothetical protein
MEETNLFSQFKKELTDKEYIENWAQTWSNSN